jgi:23S rRNA (guanine745-N1)-methyltransferase
VTTAGVTTWRCPVCAEPLAEAGDRRSWRCTNGHAFDVAKEGYVNLLITHQRRQREPGDSAEMMRDRRALLDSGAYEPLHEALQRFAGTGTVLDAGCGEGYYTRGWPDVWAVDISKPAVRLAARRAEPGARYAVASVYDLPLPDAGVDTAVNVFSPLHLPELARVVRPDTGLIVTVTAGPDHLAGLAAHLFDAVEPHPEGGPFDAATEVTLDDRQRVRFDLRLDDRATIAALLGMTPWNWYVSPEVRARVTSLSSLSTPVDFQISVYRC